MALQKHRHFYRLNKRWMHPDGYLFICNRCQVQGLAPHKFIRYNDFWK